MSSSLNCQQSFKSTACICSAITTWPAERILRSTTTSPQVSFNLPKTRCSLELVQKNPPGQKSIFILVINLLCQILPAPLENEGPQWPQSHQSWPWCTWFTCVWMVLNEFTHRGMRAPRAPRVIHWSSSEASLSQSRWVSAGSSCSCASTSQALLGDGGGWAGGISSKGLSPHHVLVPGAPGEAACAPFQMSPVSDIQSVAIREKWNQ